MGNFLARKILEAIPNRLWGIKPNLMKYIVADKGGFGALRWFMSNMPKYEDTLATWGPIKTHLCAAAISLGNGCRYCVMGHGVALQLYVLREKNMLLPLTDDQLFELSKQGPEAIARELEKAVKACGYTEKETAILSRFVSMYSKGEKPRQGNDDDKRLGQMISMFKVLNTCGTKHSVPIDEVHDPINRDRPLKERYLAMRKAQAQAVPAASPAGVGPAPVPSA